MRLDICGRTSLLPRSCAPSGHLAALGVSLTCQSSVTGNGSLTAAIGRGGVARSSGANTGVILSQSGDALSQGLTVPLCDATDNGAIALIHSRWSS